MPHKQKRKRDEDASNFDLPPTSRARTLTVHQKQESIFTSDADKKRKHEARKQKKQQKREDYKDDTPKAFKRLMAFQQNGKRIPSGLDDGSSTSKKKGKSKTTPDSKLKANTSEINAGASISTTQPSTTPAAAAATSNALKILPTESLSSFSQRVDHSLPLTSIPKHKTRLSAIPGLEKIKTPLTKHNKKLARLQKEWRATEQRLKDNEEELDEDLAEKREEDGLVWLGAGIDPSNPSSRKKRRRKGGGDVDDADPWKILEKKRREEGELRQRSLQDVVQAPPVLKPLKNIFKEKSERTGGLTQRGISRSITT